MVFLNKVDPDDRQSVGCSISLPVAPLMAPLFGSWVSTEVSWGGTAVPACSTQCWGTVAAGDPKRGVPQLQDAGGRAFLATSTKPPGLKATRTIVKLMIVREPRGVEDAMEVQKKILLVSDRFVRGQIDPGSLCSGAGMWGPVWMSSFRGSISSRKL